MTCLLLILFTAPLLCITGDIRLQGGTRNQGRVEICFGGVWGTVCENDFDKSDAQVACKQLGFTSNSKTSFCISN